MRQAVAIGVGVAVVVATLVLVLSQRGEHIASTNSRVRVSAIALPVKPGEDSCARLEELPAGADAVRVFAGTGGRPGGPLELTIRDGGRAISGGRASEGYRTGPLRIPIRPASRDVEEPIACLHNGGDRTVTFAGNATPLSQAAAQDRGNDVPRMDVMRPGRETWWELSPTIADRFSRIKPTFVGPWTMWVVLAFFAALAAASIALVRRESR